MSKEYYINNYSFIKQALSRASMVAIYPSDPNLEEAELADALAEFNEMIACEFHMALACFHKENFSRAIFFAECAKNDCLHLPGMTAYNPQMLPFYKLLQTCYAWYAKKNHASNHMSLCRTHMFLAKKYDQLFNSIKEEHEIGDEAEHPMVLPKLPDLADPKYGVPYDATEEEGYDATYSTRFELECELFESCKLHANLFLEDSWVDKAYEEVFAQLLLQHAKQLFKAGDYKSAFFHIMRGLGIMLQLLNYDYYAPSLLSFYESLTHFCSTMHGFGDIDEDSFFAIEAEFYQDRLDQVNARIAEPEKPPVHEYISSASTTPIRCSPNSL